MIFFDIQNLDRGIWRSDSDGPLPQNGTPAVVGIRAGPLGV